MSGINMAILVGRLTKDPETKTTNSGITICNFGLATSRDWKTEDGEKKEKTEFHNIVAFRQLATLCGKYLTKGRQVYISGEIQTRNYEKDGVKHYRTEIVADKVEFLGSPKEQSDIPAALDPQFAKSSQGGEFAKKVKGLPNSAPGKEPTFDSTEEIPF